MIFNSVFIINKRYEAKLIYQNKVINRLVDLAL